MMRLPIAMAIACALAGTLAAAPPRASVVPLPSVVRHSGVAIVSQRDSAASLVGVMLFVPAGLDRQSLAQNGLAALTAQSILRTPVASSLALEDAVAAQGGAITFDVDARDVRFYVEGTSATEPALLELFERALAAPQFSTTAVDQARERLGRRIAANQQIALKVGMEMLDRQFFSAPNVGMPEFGTPISLAQFVPSDAQTFYARTYRRSGDVISAVGALDALPAAALDRLAGTLAPGGSIPVTMKIPELRGASRQLVTHRNIAAPWLVAQYRAPALGSRDFGAMLVLSAFINRTLIEVAGVPALVSRSLTDRAIGTIYKFDDQPASMVVYVDGGLGDPSRTFSAALAVIHVIASTKIQGSIAPFKAAATGRFIDDTTSLADRAWVAGVVAEQGAPSDNVNRTLAAIAAVTPADLQRVARLYLADPTFAVILPRDGA